MINLVHTAISYIPFQIQIVIRIQCDRFCADESNPFPATCSGLRYRERVRVGVNKIYDNWPGCRIISEKFCKLWLALFHLSKIHESHD